MATQSVIAHFSIKTPLLALLKERIDSTSASADLDSAAQLRGLFSTASAARVQAAVEDALAHGATIAAGRFSVEGNVVQPLLLQNVTPACKIYRDEMFGPVFSLLEFETEEEAIEIANDNDYGLAAAVFSRDTERAYGIAREIDAGMIHVNGASESNRSS